MDMHTKLQRSRNMAAIRAKDTKPELIVRKLAHRLGYRFRLHRRDLPGCPDMVFPRLRKVIFVHGCYWHMHRCRWGSATPQTNMEFWRTKRTGNVTRDRRNLRALRAMEWQVLVIWECQTRDAEQLLRRIKRFLRNRY